MHDAVPPADLAALPEPVLEADGLACRRGERVLFAGLSLALRPGEALHVAGPNGTGKSSLLRILAGLAQPMAGALTVRESLGLMDERCALDSSWPLGRALAFWQRIDGSGAPHAASLGLAGLEDVPVGYLSTGQRKRAAFARLLAQEARIWLLDEPLNGLDTDAVALVERLVADHCARGGVAVIASHQPFALAGMRRLDLEALVVDRAA